MYDIELLVPDELFLNARDIAGNHIQNMMNKTPSDFVWIRSELTDPAFDDMNFRYKNQVFSVLIKVFLNGHEITDPERQEFFMEETKNYNMIPCIFPVDMNLIATGIGFMIKPGEFPKHKLTPRFAKDWNLIHAETGAPINPLDLASDEPILMSEYELNNFAIRIVSKLLKDDGGKLESFCDIPGVSPQIWFQDSTRKMCWVCVKYGTQESELTRPDNFEILELSKQPQINKHDGYFATVEFTPIKGKPYRGSGFHVKCPGLVNIYDDNERLWLKTHKELLQDILDCLERKTPVSPKTFILAVQDGVSTSIIQKMIPLYKDINATDDNGKTALHHCAVSNADMILLQSLIDAGIDTSIRDKDGKTALDLLEKEGL